MNMKLVVITATVAGSLSAMTACARPSEPASSNASAITPSVTQAPSASMPRPDGRTSQPANPTKIATAWWCTRARVRLLRLWVPHGEEAFG